MNQALLRTLNQDLNGLAREVDGFLQKLTTDRPITLSFSKNPSVLILGGSFAGLETAQKIRRYARDLVDVTVIDRKSYLLFTPNILSEVLADRDPAATLHMPINRALVRDGVHFLLGEVREIDVERNRLRVALEERPGQSDQTITYDYLIIALGSRLAYEAIVGFSAYGQTLTDTFHANRLRYFLHHQYRGGPIVIGSARFHQGTALDHWIPTASAACEGPLVETVFALGNWLTRRGANGNRITFFTPDTTFAKEIGAKAAAKLVEIAGQKGYRFLPNILDVAAVTADGVRFINGQQAEAELAIVLPDWVPHTFLKGLPISDDRGFVITDQRMRNPRYPHVFAVGDAAAATVPKLGYLAHLQSDVVAWQIAQDVGGIPAHHRAPLYQPLFDCLGIMGPRQGFFIRSNAWYGGQVETMKAGPVPYYLKALYKSMFFLMRGRLPNWSVIAANLVADRLSINML